MTNLASEAAMDRLSVHTIRLLAADMVERANSGHLGAPFGCAPLASALWGKIMKYSPRRRWLNRDRFVLSAGHASALQYVMLHLTGHGKGGPDAVTMDELKAFRQAGSCTPGHPEFRMTNGVEVTTGPLGQGFANAVGMAIAEAHMAARFNRPNFPLFDHHTYVVAGDGCMMEGVASEAASLAGHLKLSKLIVFYDDNKVTIDGMTDLVFTEDVGARFAAYGWNVVRVDNGDAFDASVYERAVQEAKSQDEKPTIIMMKTTIGYGAGAGIENTPKAHGGKFGNLEKMRERWMSKDGLLRSGDAIDAEIAGVLASELAESGETTAGKFFVPKSVLRKFREAAVAGDRLADEWEDLVQEYFRAFRASEPELVADLESRLSGKFLLDGWQAKLNSYLRSEQQNIFSNLGTLFNSVEEEEENYETRELERAFSNESMEPDAKRRRTDQAPFKHKAGRVYVHEALRALVESSPSLIGSSPDVGVSTGCHFPALQGSFLPPAYGKKYPGASYAGRYLHFGIREHAGLAILNGISSSTCLVPYHTGFTIFYQYALPAIRMASISKFPILYVGTHDSIDVGEDGPTHQPVEVLPQLRAMPNLLVIRPATVEETVGAVQIWADQHDKRHDVAVDPKPLVSRPVFLMASRGELGLPYKSNTLVRGQDGVWKGAYVVHDCHDELTAKHSQIQQPTSRSVRDTLPDIVLIGSGQDVATCMKAKELLLQWSRAFNDRLMSAFSGFPSSTSLPAPALVKVRVVSMPCWELFDEQDQEYQDSVLLSNHTEVLRIYVEKASTKNTGHDKYADYSVLMPSYGISGKTSDVERKLEFTPDHIAAKVWATWMDRGRVLSKPGDEPDSGPRTWVSRMGRRAGAH